MSDVDTNGGKHRRRNKRWPEALKREIIAATLAPGASVSTVARQYNVNANQVFGWRRRYGEASKPAAAPPSTSGLVPVTIVPEPVNTVSENMVGAATTTMPASETIEIEVAGECRVHVGSSFDARALKRVLDVLRKR